MNITDKGLNLLCVLEGFREHPYDDQTGRPIANWVRGATVGYGHLIPYQQWDKYRKGISKEDAQELLRKDLKLFEDNLNRMVKPEDLLPHQIDALLIFMFNIGIAGFNRSSVLRIVNGEKLNRTLAASWMLWNKSQGKVMRGLERRRKIEIKLYETGVYDAL